jgi:hypothetical protein
LHLTPTPQLPRLIRWNHNNSPRPLQFQQPIRLVRLPYQEAIPRVSTLSSNPNNNPNLRQHPKDKSHSTNMFSLCNRCRKKCPWSINLAREYRTEHSSRPSKSNKPCKATPPKRLRCSNKPSHHNQLPNSHSINNPQAPSPYPHNNLQNSTTLPPLPPVSLAQNTPPRTPLVHKTLRNPTP